MWKHLDISRSDLHGLCSLSRASSELTASVLTPDPIPTVKGITIILATDAYLPAFCSCLFLAVILFWMILFL